VLKACKSAILFPYMVESEWIVIAVDWFESRRASGAGEWRKVPSYIDSSRWRCTHLECFSFDSYRALQLWLDWNRVEDPKSHAIGWMTSGKSGIGWLRLGSSPLLVAG
jgi:hypothetical protein